MSTEDSPQQNHLIASLQALYTWTSGVTKRRPDALGPEPSCEGLVPVLAKRVAMPGLSQTAGPALVQTSNGLPPVAGPDCRILILGSLPGVESLRLQQYYAHPRNAFWELMGTVCGFPSALPYPHRLRALLARDIALWDVLASGHRPGSLDSAIDLQSAKINPFDSFLRGAPALTHILFNGALAERLFVQRVLPDLPSAQQGILRLRLPSTSPANASVSRQDKIAAWRAALDESR